MTPTVLVTGASRGLGRGIAQACARAGYSIGVHYSSNEAAAAETVRICQSAAASPEQRFVPVRGNIGAAADRAAILDAMVEAFGGIDALVNNAGIAPPVRADLTETSEASYDEVMGVNLKGPHFLTQLVARHWLEGAAPSARRAILFVTSISADTASINRGEYCMAKAGLSMSAQLWAVRLAPHGIPVYEVRPGIMETDMTSGVKGKYDALIASGLIPQMRWGTPADVGLAVAAILKGQFPFSTGAIIPVDGGFHLRRL